MNEYAKKRTDERKRLLEELSFWIPHWEKAVLQLKQEKLYLTDAWQEKAMEFRRLFDETNILINDQNDVLPRARQTLFLMQKVGFFRKKKTHIRILFTPSGGKVQKQNRGGNPYLDDIFR